MTIRRPAVLEDWLVGGGEMAKAIKARDWSRTPLGSMESWPQSLRTTVSLVQASNSPISLAWGPGHTQIYNDGYWPICGDKHPTSMGQDFRECWASAFPVIGEAYATAWSGKSAYLEKMRMFLDRYGFLEETWFTFSFSPITDESGGVGGLFHPVTEMTSQMLSERRTKTLRDLAGRAGKARTSEEAFALSAEVLAESDLDLPFVLFYRLDGECRQARLIGHTGLNPGTHASPVSIDLVAPGEQPWRIREVARTGVARQIEDTAARLAGMAIGPHPESPKLAFAVPITQPGSERPAGVMVAGVSSRLQLNEEYRAFYHLTAAAVSSALANARAYEEERQRAEALAEIDRVKTAFFSNVSHEFRTPLTLILGPLEDELAEIESPLPPVRRERLEAAHRNSLRLLKLVNALLDFSRIEAGRIQATYEPADLASDTAELASVFRSAIEKAGLTLTIDAPPMPEPIYVDREMWEKIVLNLVSNAFKHTFEGGIEVSLRWLGDQVELAVKDTGIGIREEEIAHLFARFHRVKGAKSRSHEGTGIGLALVQELARLHSGAVQVASQEGRGSTFTVTIKTGRNHLPADRVEPRPTPASTATRASAFVEEALNWLPGAQAPAAAQATADLARDGSTLPLRAASAAAPRARIVWADDNADMREYVRRLLAEHYDVLAVPDGAAALAAARESRPDLILTDVMMPGLDGFGLLRELRANPLTQAVPVILLSARAGEESALEGLEAGADDYVVKPFSARELLARVRTHLELGKLRRQWAGELERANKELEAFSYSVSHDLRAPLRAIDGFSKALLADHGTKLDDEGRFFLERVRAGTQRMAALIEDLLDLSRISRSHFRRQTVDLTEIASSAIAEIRRREPSREVIVEIAEGLSAQADARLITILLENLLGNAWKFTARQPAARIALGQERKGSESVFSVSDNGAGFDMAYAGKLFAPFQRLHPASEFEGTGIGLATVRRIISRHAGRVWAEAVVNGGARFFFTLGDDK